METKFGLDFFQWTSFERRQKHQPTIHLKVTSTNLSIVRHQLSCLEGQRREEGRKRKDKKEIEDRRQQPKERTVQLSSKESFTLSFSIVEGIDNVEEREREREKGKKLQFSRHLFLQAPLLKSIPVVHVLLETTESKESTSLH